MDFPAGIDIVRASKTSAKRRSSGRTSFRHRVRRDTELLEGRTLLSAVSWNVLSDTTGSSPGDPYSLRGVALSNDGSNLYAGYIHSSGIDEISTTNSAVGASVSTPDEQPKGLATDDRGNVYATLNTGSAATSQPWMIYSSDLVPVSGTNFMSATTDPKQLSGMAVQKLDGHYYLYISSNKGAGTIERWNVDDPSDPVLDTSWGTNGIIDLQSSSFGLGANSYVNGLVVDTDGTIYATGGVSTTDRGDTVFKISPNGLSVEGTASVSGAMDDALDGGQLYVTQYLGPDSEIAVLNTSDLSLSGTITDSPKGAYANTTPDSQGYDAGYSGIAISTSGQIYVAEQLYTDNNDGLFHDRVLVSSPIAAPTITSANAASFTAGTSGSFTVDSSGSPTASLSESGTLPPGVSFTDNGDGTATLTGIPDSGSGGVYTIAISAQSYAGVSTQSFTLSVDQPPAISSAGTTSFQVGSTGTFTVTTTGTPAAALTEKGTLPSGLTFVDNGNGTATLSGKPAAGTQGSYPITITANDGVAPNATQSFTLVVNAAPAITSANATSFAQGSSNSFTVTATGSPTATLSASGTLPTGVTFVDNGNGTATLSGTPSGAAGNFTLTITAHNSALPDATQTFILTVVPATISSEPTGPSNPTTQSLPTIGYLAGNPGDGSAQTFIQNLYQELLGRQADGAGLSFWTVYLAEHSTASARQQVITSFLNSAEYKLHWVAVVYETLLGRAPEAGGLQYWAQLMGSPATPGSHDGGADEKSILTAILGSDEFYIRSGNTAQGFVTALYNDLLGRSPDATGLASWSNALTAQPGNRQAVVQEILDSPEFNHLLLDTFYPAAGGTANNPLPVPGTGVPSGSSDLAIITGDGWESLYFQGPFAGSPQANDVFYVALMSGAQWDDVQFEMLNSAQYYANSNRPVTRV
ncbi:MAG TPA: DUF4214 domain-containing protein [Pirellulales bacterium]|nr:DUF4214 domain-containing protein [Pirellulales bacterium]